MKDKIESFSCVQILFEAMPTVFGAQEPNAAAPNVLLVNVQLGLWTKFNNASPSIYPSCRRPSAQTLTFLRKSTLTQTQPCQEAVGCQRSMHFPPQCSPL